MPKKKKSKKKKNSTGKKVLTVVLSAVLLIVLFFGVFALTITIVNIPKEKPDAPDETAGQTVSQEEPGEVISYQQVPEPDPEPEPEPEPAPTSSTTASATDTTTKKDTSTTTTSSDFQVLSGKVIPYPTDTSSWELICLNKNRCVDSGYESSLSLKYVAGSGERMDSRAAAAYEKMYSAAAADGIYLTPCSGYRSYSTQKRLFNEFVNEYLAKGYSQQEAYDLTSTRRNPPGSSEHNIGICMDIICAASSANFQNTKAYAWLTENAADYGFILRYPEDKADITGVKFEPWHWRYVGVDNAHAIRDSGLCLEEYLGLV